MSVRKIRQIGDPFLQQRAEKVPANEITSTDIQSVIQDMIDTMRHANGAGLAANQIGFNHRIVVIEVNENLRYPYKPPIPLTIIINPEIDFISNETFNSNEGCLSVPQMRGVVQRHTQIKVAYWDEEARRQSKIIEGYSACTWQHEVDHLDGILFPHRVTQASTFCSWSSFIEFKQADFTKQVEKLVAKWGA